MFPVLPHHDNQLHYFVFLDKRFEAIPLQLIFYHICRHESKIRQLLRVIDLLNKAFGLCFDLLLNLLFIFHRRLVGLESIHNLLEWGLKFGWIFCLVVVDFEVVLVGILVLDQTVLYFVPVLLTGRLGLLNSKLPLEFFFYATGHFKFDWLGFLHFLNFLCLLLRLVFSLPLLVQLTIIEPLEDHLVFDRSLLNDDHAGHLGTRTARLPLDSNRVQS